MKKYLLTIFVLLCACLVLLEQTRTSALSYRLIFFDVGQGDSTLIFFDDGKKMLVDCGKNNTVLSKLGTYLPFYDRTIDYLLVTHPDLDHYGGCSEVLKRYEVKNIITNGEDADKGEYWEIWEENVVAEGAVEKFIQAPETLIIGNGKIEFLSPNLAAGWPDARGDNDKSIVFRLTLATTTYLFTGDLETAGENELIEKYCPTTTPCSAFESDYLKVGHHGSGGSSGEKFTTLISPEYSVISVGKNSYGHPSQRTINKLEKAGSEVWRTDELGDIIIR